VKRSRKIETKLSEKYSKNPHKRIRVLGFQADFVLLYIRCFLQNQPENVLKVFLNTA